MNKPIQRYEYGLLKIGDEGFTRSHWEAMGLYEQQHGKGFFTIYPDSIKFAQYVGVIQVNEITIEILPKVDRGNQKHQKSKWQQFLLDMLQECNWMQTWSHQKAFLQFKYNNILEAYLSIFLSKCRQLLRMGLVKKYRKEERNLFALKGKLLFNEQIRKNLIHRERFFTRHTLYDKNNIYNQVLSMAIQLVPTLTSNPDLKEQAFQLLFDFPEVDNIVPTHKLFERLTYDRKTEAYKEPISIAAMLLLNYRPDISNGNNNILALLFDMNELWEEFIYRRISMAAGDDWEIRYQNQRNFWTSSELGVNKVLKPDLVVLHSNSQSKFIIDTKWKVPDNDIPADSDLKQMFAYNEYWGSDVAILLYPSVDHNNQPQFIQGSFLGRKTQPPRHLCGIAKVSVLDLNGEHLSKEIGRHVIKKLEALARHRKDNFEEVCSPQ